MPAFQTSTLRKGRSRGLIVVVAVVTGLLWADALTTGRAVHVYMSWHTLT
jgi:hypothetical protein